MVGIPFSIRYPDPALGAGTFFRRFLRGDLRCGLWRRPCLAAENYRQMVLPSEPPPYQ